MSAAGGKKDERVLGAHMCKECRWDEWSDVHSGRVARMFHKCCALKSGKGWTFISWLAISWHFIICPEHRFKREIILPFNSIFNSKSSYIKICYLQMNIPVKNPKSTSFQFWSRLVVVPPVRSAQTTMSTFAFPNISGLKRLLNKDALGTQETSQNFLLRRFWLCIMMAGSYCPPCLYPPAFGKLPPLSDMVRSGWIATAWCSQPQIREGE